MKQSSLTTEDNLTKTIKPTVYGNDMDHHAKTQQLDNMQFVVKKSIKQPSATSRPLSQTELYLNDQFIPRMPAKHLADAPKFLFSLQRKRLRIKNGSLSKNIFGNALEKSHSRPEKQKMRFNRKSVERCKHTHQVHTAQSPKWCIVPPVMPRQRADQPHFLFNMHHMRDRQNQYALTMQGFQRRITKGANTSFYGCHTAAQTHRQTSHSVRSFISRKSGFDMSIQ